MDGLKKYSRSSEIEQVIINLVNKAIDAVKEEPNKDVERWVQIEVRKDVQSVVLVVSDSGPGNTCFEIRFPKAKGAKNAA